MGLFSRLRGAPQSLPLEVPDPNAIQTPVLLFAGKRSAAEVSNVIAEIRRVFDTEGEAIAPTSKPVTSALLNLVGWRLRSTDENVAFGSAAALGVAAAIVEERRGWQQPGQIDARVHSAMASFTTMGSWGEDVKDVSGALSYFVFAGYWVARAGDDGLQAMLDNAGPGLRGWFPNA